MIYIHVYISGLCEPHHPRRSSELVWRLLAPAKPCKGLDEVDPHAEYLIQLNVVEGLEEELGDRGPLLVSDTLS
jgi:hypothetical protein